LRPFGRRVVSARLKNNRSRHLKIKNTSKLLKSANKSKQSKAKQAKQSKAKQSKAKQSKEALEREKEGASHGSPE